MKEAHDVRMGERPLARVQFAKRSLGALSNRSEIPGGSGARVNWNVIREKLNYLLRRENEMSAQISDLDIALNTLQASIAQMTTLVGQQSQAIAQLQASRPD